MKKIIITAIAATAILATSAFSATFTEKECYIFNNIKNYTKTFSNNLDLSTSAGRANNSAINGTMKGHSDYLTEKFGKAEYSLIKNTGLGVKFDYSYLSMIRNHYNFIKFLENDGTESLQYYFTFLEGRMKTFLEEYKNQFNTDLIIDFNLKTTIGNLEKNQAYNVFEPSTFISFVLLNLDNNYEKVYSKGYSIDEDKDLKEFFKLIMLKKYEKAKELMYIKATKPKYKEIDLFKKENWTKVIQDRCKNIY